MSLPTPATYTHKSSEWSRIATRDGSMRWRIVPTDNSGERMVRFLSAHSWCNDANDDRAKANTDRIVLLDGPPLPEWAIEWLMKANAKSCGRAREAFRAAIDDADWAQDRRDSDSY